MPRRLIIHRGLDANGEPQNQISLEQWQAVARSFSQIHITNKSTKGHPYEGMAEWRRENTDEPVTFQPYGGVIYVDDAPDLDEPLVREIAAALDAQWEELVEDEFEYENVRLEFTTPQDYGQLSDLGDMLNEVLAAAGAGEIIGEGGETGITSSKSDFGEALAEMRQKRTSRDGDRLCFQTYVFHIQAPNIEQVLDILQTTLPKTGRIPPGTKVLLENEDGEFDLRFTL